MTFIDSIPPDLPCINCYQLFKMLSMTPLHESYELKEKDLSGGVQWSFIRKHMFHEYPLSNNIFALDTEIKCWNSIIDRSSSKIFGCSCCNCCLQFYIQTNGYSLFIKWKPSNKEYKYYSALMALHGPHLHYLLLKKCSKNKILFNNLFGYHCRRIIFTEYAGYATRHFFDFLECSKWLKFKHIEWILTSYKNIKFMIHFMRNYHKNEQFKNCVDTIFVRIHQYSIKYKVKYNKFLQQSKSS
eukprot:52826_1